MKNEKFVTKWMLIIGILCFSPSFAADKPKVDGDIVVARVNGEQVMLSEVEASYKSLPAPYRQTPIDQLFVKLVDQLVDQKLALAAAKSAKIDQTEAYQKKMADYAEEAMVRTYLQAELDKLVTEKELKEAYEILARSMPEERNVRHILVSTEDDAKKARTEALAGDFGKIADKYSKDKAATGGALGWIREAQVVKEFGAVAFKMKAGEVSNPVKSQFGWHVIKVEEIRQSPPPPFEEAEKPLKDELQQNILPGLLKGLRKTAKVERYDALGRPLPPEVVAPSKN